MVKLQLLLLEPIPADCEGKQDTFQEASIYIRLLTDSLPTEGELFHFLFEPMLENLKKNDVIGARCSSPRILQVA